ncbi:MAG TPA: DinB family protein [Thermoanaerobaculia bacterium]|nr:DinB family protein [Thermoanaerobaculia bacterium]
MGEIEILRSHLERLLDWEDAHVGFEAVIEGIPPEVRGAQPRGLPYSAWQLLEHLRLCQRDILEFCRDPGYVDPKSMAEYWPASVAPPTPEAWEESVAGFRADLEDMKRLVREGNLFAAVPRGTGQTFLREVVLLADHNAYTLGQLVVLRRLLGIWAR